MPITWILRAMLSLSLVRTLYRRLIPWWRETLSAHQAFAGFTADLVGIVFSMAASSCLLMSLASVFGVRNKGVTLLLMLAAFIAAYVAARFYQRHLSARVTRWLSPRPSLRS